MLKHFPLFTTKMNILPDSILKKLLLKEDLFTKRKTLEATISCIKQNKNVDLNRKTLMLKKEREELLREITSLNKILKNKTKVLQVRLEKIDKNLKNEKLKKKTDKVLQKTRKKSVRHGRTRDGKKK